MLIKLLSTSHKTGILIELGPVFPQQINLPLINPALNPADNRTI